MLVSFGVIIMDMFPSQKGLALTEVKSFMPVPGGASANVAVAARRLGVPCAFLGKVGDEQFGHFLCDTLQADGVDTSGMVFDKDIRTTLNFHAIRPDGSVEYLFYRNPGADISIRKDELDRRVLEKADIFHFDSLSVTGEPGKSAVDAAIDRCRKNGALISFDVNYRPVLWDSPQKAVKQCMEYIKKADIVKLNETEMELFTGSGLKDGAGKLLQAGAKTVLVTLGDKGAYFVHGGFDGTVEGYRVDVVDPIGCGDAFIAGFLSMLIKEGLLGGTYKSEELERCCRFANAAAALTATKYGCIPAMPALEDVLKFMGEREK